MGTAVPDRVKLSFVIFESWHSDANLQASECRDIKNYKITKKQLNPVWHRMLFDIQAI